MKITIAHTIRKIVALLSMGNLKEYLTKAVAVLPPDNALKPIIVKEILENKTLKEEGLKNTLAKLKKIVKEYHPDLREPFQKTILEPIQAFYSPVRFNPTNMFEMIRDQKAIMQKSEKELSKAKGVIQKDKAIPFPKVLA